MSTTSTTTTAELELLLEGCNERIKALADQHCEADYMRNLPGLPPIRLGTKNGWTIASLIDGVGNALMLLQILDDKQSSNDDASDKDKMRETTMIQVAGLIKQVPANVEKKGQELLATFPEQHRSEVQRALNQLQQLSERVVAELQSRGFATSGTATSTL